MSNTQDTNIVKTVKIVDGKVVVTEMDLGSCGYCGAPLELHCGNCTAVYCEACEYA